MKHYCTESALLKVHNDIIISMDKGEVIWLWLQTQNGSTHLKKIWTLLSTREPTHMTIKNEIFVLWRRQYTSRHKKIDPDD